MNLAAHTPGPWSVDLGNNTRTTEIWAGDVIIADVHSHVTESPGGTEHADAQLIAAAPELLAALTALLNDPAVIAAASPADIGRALCAIKGI